MTYISPFEADHTTDQDYDADHEATPAELADDPVVYLHQTAARRRQLLAETDHDMTPAELAAEERADEGHKGCGCEPDPCLCEHEGHFDGSRHPYQRVPAGSLCRDLSGHHASPVGAVCDPCATWCVPEAVAAGAMVPNFGTAAADAIARTVEEHFTPDPRYGSPQPPHAVSAGGRVNLTIRVEGNTAPGSRFTVQVVDNFTGEEVLVVEKTYENATLEAAIADILTHV